MKILFLTTGAETFASSRTRVYQYLPHLAKYGISTTVLAAEPNLSRQFDSFRIHFDGLMRKAYNRFYHTILLRIVERWRYQRCMQAIKMAPDYDLVYIQKLDLPAKLYTKLRGRAKKIVYDIDDAIFLREHRRKRVDEQIRTSDLMIVASEYLVDYVLPLNANVMVLPTPIDTDRYGPRPDIASEDFAMGPVTIGWIGTEPNTKYLELVSPSLQQLLQHYGDRIQLNFIGADPHQLSVKPSNVYAWSLESEVARLHTFDIGIMPLPDSDEWAGGKAGYKLLQYMAIGIPCVASPIGVNKTIIDHGVNGFLATDQSEWISYLGQLIDSPELRYKMGLQGRKIAEEHYSHRFLANRLVDLLAPFAK